MKRAFNLSKFIIFLFALFCMSISLPRIVKADTSLGGYNPNNRPSVDGHSTYTCYSNAFTSAQYSYVYTQQTKAWNDCHEKQVYSAYLVDANSLSILGTIVSSTRGDSSNYSIESYATTRQLKIRFDIQSIGWADWYIYGYGGGTGHKHSYTLTYTNSQTPANYNDPSQAYGWSWAFVDDDTKQWYSTETVNFSQKGTIKCTCTDSATYTHDNQAPDSLSISPDSTTPSYTETGQRMWIATGTGWKSSYSRGTSKSDVAANNVRECTNAQTLASLNSTRVPESGHSLNAAYGITTTATFTGESSSTRPDGVQIISTTYKWYKGNSSLGTAGTELTEDNGLTIADNVVTFTPERFDSSLETIYCIATTTLKDTIADSTVKTITGNSGNFEVWASGAQATFNAEVTSSLGKLYYGPYSTGSAPLAKGSALTREATYIKAENIIWKYSNDQGNSWHDIPGSDVFNTDINVIIDGIVPGPNDNSIIINNGPQPTGNNLSTKTINTKITIVANDLNLRDLWLCPIVGNSNSDYLEGIITSGAYMGQPDGQPVRYNLDTFYDWIRIRQSGSSVYQRVSRIKLNDKTFTEDGSTEADTYGNMYHDNLIRFNQAEIGYGNIKQYNFTSVDDSRYYNRGVL